MILAIETSDILCSVAFWANGKTILEYNLEQPMQHASLVGKLVKEGLLFLNSEERNPKFTSDDIALCTVALGPGSFTGLRIGLSYAQGFCYGRRIPIVGISNQQVLAAFRNTGMKEVYTIIEARRNEVYLAEHKFTTNGFPEMETLNIVNKNDLVSRIPEGAQLIHNKHLQLDTDVEQALQAKKIFISSQIQYTASTLAWLGNEKYKLNGADSLAEIEPLYIRPFAGVQ